MIKRGIITAILTIALALLSFGHQSLSPASEAQVQSYILAGGSWADLCGDGGDPLAGVGKCTACVISQGCALPPPLDTHHPSEVGTTIAWPITNATTTLATHTGSHRARAPPFV
jgi:hypothetical protein